MVDLINFSHPITQEALSNVQSYLGEEVKMIQVPQRHFDTDRTFVDQTVALVDSVGLTDEEWQTRRIIINPPSLGTIAVITVAELHGRMGHFPSILRLKPSQDSVVSGFEFAEVVSLQRVRDSARARRR